MNKDSVITVVFLLYFFSPALVIIDTFSKPTNTITMIKIQGYIRKLQISSNMKRNSRPTTEEKRY